MPRHVLKAPNTTCYFRSEQFFGSPSDTATAADGVRERLLLVEEKHLQLQEMKLHKKQEEEVPNGLEGRLDVIGEEPSEKEEQDEEEKEAEPQEDDLERATQDC